ncbi:hypothetical protein SprV_0100123600 [Sparganum proliferum]
MPGQFARPWKSKGTHSNEWKNFFAATKAVYGPPIKAISHLLSEDGSTLLTEKTQTLQRWASSTVPPPYPPLPSLVCLNWRPKPTSTSHPLFTKPSGPCSNSPAGKCPARERSPLSSLIHHCMGLFGHMRIYESEIDHSPDTPCTSSTQPCLVPPTLRSPAHPPPPAPPSTSLKLILTPSTSHVHTVPVHSPRALADLRINRTETDEPVLGAQTCTRRIRLHCPHRTRIFIHRMGLLGHRRVHENPQ